MTPFKIYPESNYFSSSSLLSTLVWITIISNMDCTKSPQNDFLVSTLGFFPPLPWPYPLSIFHIESRKIWWKQVRSHHALAPNPAMAFHFSQKKSLSPGRILMALTNLASITSLFSFPITFSLTQLSYIVLFAIPWILLPLDLSLCPLCQENSFPRSLHMAQTFTSFK